MAVGPESFKTKFCFLYKPHLWYVDTRPNLYKVRVQDIKFQFFVFIEPKTKGSKKIKTALCFSGEYKLFQ